MSNENRDDKGRYATYWRGLCSFAALVLILFLFMAAVAAWPS